MATVLAPEKWNRKATLTYLKMGLDALPEPFQTQESNKLTIVYFILSAYDVMGALDSTILSKPDLSSQIIDYVYSLQVSLSPDSPDSNVCGGFRGGTNNGNPWNPSCKVTEKIEWDYGHLANTYVALAILKMMGDDFGKVNRQSIIASLKNLQLEDGSFRSIPIDSESDMRFIYCAAVISHMLNDWSGIDIDRATRYILASQAYDGAFGQGPGLEGHGGSTYCALAALKLMGRLDDLPKRDQLIFWLTQRQVTGFQGRINKDPDTCYSWWIGASLHILDSFQFVDQKNLQSFILECQSGFGGFIKCLDSKYPDPLHTYFSICGLQMSGAEGLRELDYGIGITTRAAATRTVFD